MPEFSTDAAGVAAAMATARAAVDAAGQSWRWWQVRRRRSPKHRQGRVLHLELVHNLVMCRHGQAGTPPMLFVTSKEWDRPGTRELVAELLPAKSIASLASPYVVLDNFRWIFGQPWTETLGVRARGQDAVLLGQLADQFAAAELELRKRLYSGKGQAEVGRVLGTMLPTPPRGYACSIEQRDRRDPLAISVPGVLALHRCGVAARPNPD